MSDKTNRPVKYNIRNCHYAVMTPGETNLYGTPKPLPGAVSITLSQQGDVSEFYADGIRWYVGAANSGYQGDLVLAILPEEFRKDVLQETEDTNKVLFENANVDSVPFALGFTIDGNKSSEYFWFLSCTAQRPSVEANTNTSSINPDTDSITISASADDNGNIRTRTTPDTPASVKTAWFSSVYDTPAAGA